MKYSTSAAPAFLICVRNSGYEASLEPLKLYRVVPDSDAHEEGLVRVIDESGEDYLYPGHYFLPVKLTPEKRKALAKVAARRAA